MYIYIYPISFNYISPLSRLEHLTNKSCTFNFTPELRISNANMQSNDCLGHRAGKLQELPGTMPFTYIWFFLYQFLYTG